MLVGACGSCPSRGRSRGLAANFCPLAIPARGALRLAKKVVSVLAFRMDLADGRGALDGVVLMHLTRQPADFVRFGHGPPPLGCKQVSGPQIRATRYPPQRDHADHRSSDGGGVHTVRRDFCSRRVRRLARLDLEAAEPKIPTKRAQSTAESPADNVKRGARGAVTLCNHWCRDRGACPDGPRPNGSEARSAYHSAIRTHIALSLAPRSRSPLRIWNDSAVSESTLATTVSAPLSSSVENCRLGSRAGLTRGVDVWRAIGTS